MTARTRYPDRRNNRPRGVLSRNPAGGAARAKAAGEVKCVDCGLIQRQGRWSRAQDSSSQPRSGLCPACERTRTKRPAGTLRLDRSLLEHGDEILKLALNEERVEVAEHALERVLGVTSDGDDLLLTTTGNHLARRIARAIARTFHRRAEFQHEARDGTLHVTFSAGRTKSGKRRGT